MAAPTYDGMKAPLLALAAKGTISRKASADIIAGHFKLSPEDREARTPQWELDLGPQHRGLGDDIP